MRRNLKFLYLTDVQISWISPHLTCVWCGECLHMYNIYAVLLKNSFFLLKLNRILRMWRKMTTIRYDIKWGDGSYVVPTWSKQVWAEKESVHTSSLKRRVYGQVHKLDQSSLHRRLSSLLQLLFRLLILFCFISWTEYKPWAMGKTKKIYCRHIPVLKYSWLIQSDDELRVEQSYVTSCRVDSSDISLQCIPPLLTVYYWWL